MGEIGVVPASRGVKVQRLACMITGLGLDALQPLRPGVLDDRGAVRIGCGDLEIVVVEQEGGRLVLQGSVQHDALEARLVDGRALGLEHVRRVVRAEVDGARLAGPPDVGIDDGVVGAALPGPEARAEIAAEPGAGAVVLLRFAVRGVEGVDVAGPLVLRRLVHPQAR